jgi:hypothetical protein
MQIDPALISPETVVSEHTVMKENLRYEKWHTHNCRSFTIEIRNVILGENEDRFIDEL